MKKTNASIHASKDYARAVHALRSSNAAGTHADKRTKRAKTRAASKARALKEYAA